MNHLLKFLAPTELFAASMHRDAQMDMFASYIIDPGAIGCVVTEDRHDYITLIGNKVLLVPKISQDILYEAVDCD